MLKFRVFSAFFLLSGIFYGQDPENISWKDAQMQDREWYSTKEAKRIANNVLLYQNENGGWLKNTDMVAPLDQDEKQVLQSEQSKDLGTTIDNGATYTQLRFLGKVYNQSQKKIYKEAFLKGIDYLLKAQYENGGWPQYYPIRKGYYEHITFNDNAMIGVMRFLRDVHQNSDFSFVNNARKQQIENALEKGLDVILSTQVQIDGKPTLWCAQHHSKDLSPAKGRAYELPSLSGAESVGIVYYLMEIEDPSMQVKIAIRSAVAWFKEHRIHGKKVVRVAAPNLPGGKDRVVVKDQCAGPLWARFNEIGTGQPIFVGRDGKPKNKLRKIEHERRMGYSYLGNYAESLLKDDYPNWEKRQ